MKYYMAPMEGLTGYIYRNAYHHHFFQMDKYFAPFIVGTSNRKMSFREWKDLVPENNAELNLIPQILTNKAGDFLYTEARLFEMGYKEVNLNLGCPSKTVVSKYKGSGFLEKTVELERFLDQIFLKSQCSISIKTRIGRYESDEFEHLLEIYNKFPLEELIIHPRVQTDYYRNQPDWNVFERGYLCSKAKVCYNGDIFSRENYEELMRRFESLETVMLGRGMIRNPELRRLLESESASYEEDQRVLLSRWKHFHDEIFMEYQKILSGDQPLLFRMKELWQEWGKSFETKERILKKIRKSHSKEEYQMLVDELFF